MVRAQMAAGGARGRTRARAHRPAPEETGERPQRPRVGAAVIEHAEDAGYAETSVRAASLRKASTSACRLARDDLRQEKIGVRVRVAKELHLRHGVGDRVGPAAELQLGMARAQLGAQLPRMFDDAGAADALARPPSITSAGKAGVRRPGRGTRRAILKRMLGGQERDDAAAGHGIAEIGHEMPEIVFLLRANGTVGRASTRMSCRASARTE
jgi:hypothetical protein